MLKEIILDIRMDFGFLYGAFQLSTHSRGIRLYEFQYQKTNYIECHRERIISERSMLLEAIRCAQQSVSYTKFIRGTWPENASFFSLIIETLEAYVDYIQCQLDENSLWDLVETNDEQLLEKKHGELFEKSGIIAEKIRLLLISIFENIEQEDRIKAFKLNDKRFGALPDLVESLDHVYYELEKFLVERLVQAG
ncbi:MAG TPA: hypothetical protein VK206_07255 [Anaerolineales bacterium]|nr:hypothetical protein [Anaerolineales bacterium]